ncbi:hypothetical protein DRP04_06940 [Archaeoglobales archaeon]|nr:MAG: hypothetical protein DRP04_06940 [Archaeoglobales archaeon]
MTKDRYRFIVELVKLTFPEGRRTVPVAYYDDKGLTYLPMSDTLNRVLREIEAKYSDFLELYEDNGYNVRDSLDWFFHEIWNYSIIRGENLPDILSEDLKVRKSKIKREILNTLWFKDLVDYTKKNCRKLKKSDPVTYAECIRQLVELLGKNEVLNLLKKQGVKIGKTALEGLARVGGETPKIKQLIREGKLPLTLAWELPRVDGEEREKIAEELVQLKNYRKQKERLKEIKKRFF